MLEKNIISSNLKNLELRGWTIGDTQEKKLACGSVGKGGLEKTKTIVEMVESFSK